MIVPLSLSPPAMRWWLVVAVVSWGLLGALAASKCRRSPLGTDAPKSNGDNGFRISISGNPRKYFPGEVYTGEYMLSY